jgi:hypothetical protein
MIPIVLGFEVLILNFIFFTFQILDGRENYKKKSTKKGFI